MLADYLSEPLEAYPGITPNIMTPTYPKPRYNTTSGWAREYLKNVTFATRESIYTGRADYQDFMSSIKDRKFRPVEQPTPFVAPRSEGDVSVAVMHSLINPMYQIVKHLGWGKLSGLTYDLLNFEVLSESYVKAQKESTPDKSADPSLDELASGKTSVAVEVTAPLLDQEPASSDGGRKPTKSSTAAKFTTAAKPSATAKSSTTTKSSTTAKSSKSLTADDATTQKPLSGVFVDKIFSWSILHGDGIPPAEDKPKTKSSKKKTKKTARRGVALAVPSSNRYLGRGELWDMENKDKAHFSSVKAILPVELKPYGHINRALFDLVRTKEGPLTTTGLPSHGYKGMQSILQQSIRYSYHYGTRFSLLTDGVCGIVLEIPDNFEDALALVDAGTQEDAAAPEVEINWKFVEKDEIKEVLAYLLWRELRDVQDLFETA